MNISATELPNFIRKHYLLHELLIFKYWRQNISVSNIASQYCSQALRRPTHTARETVHLLTHETPDFVTLALWPANSPDLNPVDYQIWWKLQDPVYRSQVTSTSWSRAWSKSGNISTRWSSIKRSGSGVHVFELAFDFEHTVDILNTDLSVLKSCHSHGRTLDRQSRLCLWTLVLLSDLTKLAVAVADVDRFCWNLVTCLQFNLAVLL